MAIDIKFDLVGNPEPPSIILANRNGNILGQLKVNTKTIDLEDNLVEPSEFSFTLNKYINNEITPLWDKVVDFKLVYCKEWDSWFEITVELDEATESVKTVLCTQLGQAELSQLMLYNIEINTEADIERDDYKISILYDEKDPEASILNRLLKDKAPHYQIAYVSPTIAGIQRSFSFDAKSILDSFQEIAEEIGCLFQYYAGKDENGVLQRKIAVFDLQQCCNECGYRGEFTDECPKCNSTNITNGYGEDTLIFVTSDELASSGIQFKTNTDSVKNFFKLEAGDDLMTATIRSCNPNGTDYIWYFSDDIKEDMSDELVKKLESYNEIYKEYYKEYVSNIDSTLLTNYNTLVDKYSVYNKDLQKITAPIIGYSSLMNANYSAIDLEFYLKSGLMPSVEMIDTNAEKEVKLLTASSLSPIAVTDVTVASLATVNNAILAMAKTIVNPIYKIQIDSSELVDGANSRSWRGNFIVTNYSDDEDTSVGNVISVQINDDLEEFIRQKVEKVLNKENTDDLSISGLFEKEYNDFCAELKKYALNPLIGIHDSCQACIDILIDQGVGNSDSWSDNEEGSEANLYEKLYLPYYNKLEAIEAEIKVRENELNIISGKYDANGNLVAEGIKTNIEKCKAEIQDALNFQNYLGETLWLEFCTYRREDKYSNENYISDGLNNAELFKRVLEFFEVAENEIYKSAELQHSISTTLNNLLAIPKFKNLVKSFKVGNWIRVRVDDEIFKLRLLKYGISYNDFNNINVEFSDVTKTKNGITDVKDILSQASSMSTSYDSVKRQSAQGGKAQGTISQWLASGLNSALVQIQNNDSEEITLSKNGLLGRSYDDITDTYSPEQFRLTHNIMAYTTDNWKTVSAALGKHLYKRWDSGDFIDDVGYGLSSTFVTAGYITSSQIIGGEIVSSNYESGKSGTYFNLIDGDFEIAGGKIVYNEDTRQLSIKDISIDWSSSTNPDVSHVIGLENSLENLSTRIEINASGITSEATRATEAEGELSSKITQTAEQIRLELNNTGSGLSSSITQTAEEIRAELNDAKNQLSSSISQTAGEIRSEVNDLEEELSSSITQTAEQIRTEVVDLEKDLSSRISQTAESITSEVNDLEKDLSSRITQTANTITSEVTRATKAEGELSSKITQNAESITSEVARATKAEGELSSKITQTATEIRSEVSADLGNLESSLSSSISQTANSIELKVSKNEIVSAINLSSESVTIKSNKIDVDGVLNVNKLNALGITAGSVAAENITGATISGKTISGGSINIGNGNFVVNTSGNMTAKSGSFGGTLDAVSGTFTSLTAGQSMFTDNYIKIDAGNNKGYILIGDPTAMGYEEISILPDKHFTGNIGNNNRAFDVIIGQQIYNISERDLKENIQVYNIEQAYDELKMMPIYTYNYIDDSHIVKKIKLGTIIDYIPSEAMANTLYGNRAFDIGNLLYWDIAATQKMQIKLEEMIERYDNIIERLNILENNFV